jgi:uncharacterized protein YjiS (DUF1127 family)
MQPHRFQERIMKFEQAIKNLTTAPTQAANDDSKTVSKFGFVDSLSHWVKVNSITRSLNQLDDRTLHDIGISRIEIREHAERLMKNRKKAA